MPPRVYRGRSAYEFHPRKGGAVRLCELDAPRSEVWRRYEEIIEEHDHANTFGTLLTTYFGSEHFKSLAPITQKNYRKYEDSLKSVFGRMKPTSIQPKHVRRYLDLRGKKSKYLANREFTFVAAVCSWGYERGYLRANPCKGVRKFSERPRDRYVTDEEYKAVYEGADTHVKIVMEIAYRCAARLSDVLGLKRSDLREEGIYLRQSKTGKAQIKRWTPALNAAVKLAKALPSDIDSFYVIHNRRGSPYTRDAFSVAWQAAKKKAAKKLDRDKLDFTFHDLKAKGISDFEGDKKRCSGHRSDSMIAVYDRKPEIVDSLGNELSGD